jgi:hypothetical protein
MLFIGLHSSSKVLVEIGRGRPFPTTQQRLLINKSPRLAMDQNYAARIVLTQQIHTRIYKSALDVRINSILDLLSPKVCPQMTRIDTDAKVKDSLEAH